MTIESGWMDTDLSYDDCSSNVILYTTFQCGTVKEEREKVLKNGLKMNSTKVKYPRLAGDNKATSLLSSITTGPSHFL